MQGQSWSGSTVDQQNSFNSSFFGADDSNGGLNMSQDAINSLYGQQPSDDMASVFGQFNPGTSSHNGFSHPSQMMMPQLSDGQMQSNALDGNTNNSGPDYSSQMMNNLNQAASTAAAAAYGHLGYNSSNPSTSSQQPQQNGEWRPNSMGDYSSNVLGSVALRAPGHFQGSVSSYDGESSSKSSNAQDLANSKRRRMTFTSSVGHHAGQPGRPDLMQSDSSGSHNNDSTQLHNFGGPDSQTHVPTRPPFRHRRSRSGSDVQGHSYKSHSHNSFDGGHASQNFPANNNFVPPPALFAAAQLQNPSYVGAQTPAALGGHAASHPPGLGSRILRGVDVSASGSSAATDFTKRKGWTGRVVEELLDFVHVLDPEGTILFASPSVYRLTGWKSEELKGRKLSEFVHPQDVVSVEREIDRMRSSKGELLTYYRFKTKPSSAAKSSKSRTDNDSSAGDTAEEKPVEHRNEVEHADAFTRDGDYIVFEATGHPYFPPEPVTVPSNGSQDAKAEDTSPKVGESDVRSPEPSDVCVKSEPMSNSLSNTSGSQPLPQTHSQQNSTGEGAGTPLRCFFCSARPYPSKNTSMLDSFLELKLENEKLRLMIADMDLGGAENDHERRNSSAAYHPDLLKQELDGDSSGWQMPINPIFGTQPAADGSGAHAGGGRRASGQFSRNNSMGSHETSPVMRTGSRDGDIAGLGLSNVDDSEEEPKTSPTAPAAAAVGTETERRKKPKQDDGDHVCTDCGRVDSPEWRKGPLGPKTLCNACGLRWAKKVKRKGGDPNVAAAPGVMGSVGGMQPHMMPLQGQHPIPLNHPPPFGRTESGQMQGMPMGRSGSMSGINMGSMISPSPTGFASMPFPGDSQQGGGQR